MASPVRRDLPRRLLRAADRLLIGAVMAMLALFLERRLRKALRRPSEDADADAEAEL